MSELYRHELKYFIGEPQRHILRQRLRPFLRTDPNAGPTGAYRISSLYFDDVADSALYEKLAGLQHRQKIRIRIYEGQPDTILLEKKIKVGEGVRKERLRISRELYEAIRAGETTPLLENGHPLLEEVAWQITNQLLRPKVIVDYLREAYVCALGNVRITFDRDLRSGLTNLDLFRPAPFAPAPVDGMTILEVKYDEFLPRPVQDLLQADGLMRQAASKYVLCRTMTKTALWEDQ